MLKVNFSSKCKKYTFFGIYLLFKVFNIVCHALRIIVTGQKNNYQIMMHCTSAARLLDLRREPLTIIVIAPIAATSMSSIKWLLGRLYRKSIEKSSLKSH